MKEPLRFEHPFFGILVQEGRGKDFEGSVTWCETGVTLKLNLGDEDSPSLAGEMAEKMWAQQELWHNRICDCAISHLLETKNDYWLEDGESAVTGEEFKKRIRVTSISMTPDGNFDFWFDDGDLFWGHAILVEGSLDEGPTDASFHG